MIELEGNLTISHPRSGNGPGIAAIEIRDAKGCSVAVRVRVDLEKFAEALLGLARVPCEISFNNSGNIGKLRKSKYVIVSRPKISRHADPEQAQAEVTEIMSGYTADGWSYRPDDLYNSNHFCGDDIVSFPIHRWLASEKGEEGAK